jgi:GNAT superfamily N-acetyltransferase
MSNELDVDTFVIIDNSHILMGWVLCSLIYRDDKITAMVYVRKSMRRKGIGTKLIEAAMKKHGKLYICPWDHASRGFYAKIQKDESKMPIIPGFSL